MNLFKGKLAGAKVNFQFKKKNDPELICYSNEIRQVLANLIQNAIDATPNGASLRIRVKTSREASW